MASELHQGIIRFIDDYVKQSVELNGRSFPIAEKVRTIKINDPDSKHVVDYSPDYAIKRNKDRHSFYYVVIEVLNKQPDYKTMTDMIRIMAHPQIRKAIFISCNKEKKKETDRILGALIGSLKNKLKKNSRKEVLDIVSREALPDDTVLDFLEMLENELKDFLPPIKINKKLKMV